MMKKKFLKIAIDGLSAVGKTTLSQALAKKYKFLYFSTGYVYRAATFYCLKANIDINNEGSVFHHVSQLLENDGLEIELSSKDPEIFVDGNSIEIKRLNREDINETVSIVAANLALRKKLIELQKQIIANTYSKTKGILVDGRDIMTVVAPDSQIKFFITASEQVRAKRRKDQFQMKKDVENVGYSLKQRDEKDIETAKNLGIHLPEDVIFIDNSSDSMDVAINKMSKTIDKNLN